MSGGVGGGGRNPGEIPPPTRFGFCGSLSFLSFATSSKDLKQCGSRIENPSIAFEGEIYLRSRRHLKTLERLLLPLCHIYFAYHQKNIAIPNSGFLSRTAVRHPRNQVITLITGWYKNGAEAVMLIRSGRHLSGAQVRHTVLAVKNGLHTPERGQTHCALVSRASQSNVNGTRHRHGDIG